MLTESMAEEKANLTVREKAQKKVSLYSVSVCCYVLAEHNYNLCLD